MVQRGTTGHRIRDRRIQKTYKQGEFARRVGISPSYLNLIEHNRRRIGGKLLIDIARALDVDPAALTEGTETRILARLLGAAAAQMDLAPEVDQLDQFAARFPGWAGLAASQAQKIGQLERRIETLTDRLAHDPILSGAMHEVLSTVTSIRSTAAILVDPQEMEPNWRARFERNLYEDSVRLAESSQALVTYLDSEQDREAAMATPQDTLEAFLLRHDFHLPFLEDGGPVPASALSSADFPNPAAQSHAMACFERYQSDAAAMPLAPFQAAVAQYGCDPGRLSREFSCDLAAAMRRLVSLPTAPDQDALGLAICDGTGSITLRRAIDGFPLPRFSAANPNWPLFQALSSPMRPIRQNVEQGQAAAPRRFLTYSICAPVGTLDFDTPPHLEATMLIVPESRMRFAPNADIRLS